MYPEMLEIKTEFTELIGIFKWILNTIYLVLAMVALFGLVKLQIRTKKAESMKQKFLFLLILISTVVRIILDFIPDNWYLNHVEIHPILQMILDLFPELLFFSLYFLLVIIWLELYYVTIIKDQNIIRWMWILMFGVIGVIFLAGFIFSIIIGSNGPYTRENLEAEAFFLATLSLLLALSFPVGSWYLFNQLKKAKSITSLRKRAMLGQLQKLVVVCILCSIAHMTYTLILEIYFKGLITNQAARAVLWLFYFIITEQLPTGLILFLVFRMTIAKVSSHKSQAIVEGRLLQPLINTSQEYKPVQNST